MSGLATREKTRLWLLILVGVVATLLGQTHAREIFAPSQPAPGVFAALTQATTGENYDACRYDAPDSLLAAKGGAGVADDAFTHGFKYDPRVRARGVQDPSSHNFPYSFDDGILATKPIPQKNGYNIYQQPGSMAGKVVTDPKTGIRTQTYKEGVFEMGVTKDGVIDHRFFKPN